MAKSLFNAAGRREAAVDDDTMAAPSRAMSKMGAAMASVPWPKEMNMCEPYVTAILWFKDAPKLDSITAAFEKHVWSCHRFNSCIENNKWVRLQEVMDVTYHFEENDVQDENEIDEFAMDTHLSVLDVDHPRWKVFILTAQSGRSAVILHIHHAVGDGLGLLFALSPMLGVEGGNPLATIPLPNSVLPPSVRAAKAANKRGSFSEDRSLLDPALTNAAHEAEQAQETQQTAEKTSSDSRENSKALKKSTRNGVGCGAGFSMGITSAISNWSRGAFTPLLAKYDTDLTINEPLSKKKPFLPFSGKRVFTRFPPLPMAAIKAVREKHGCSMNDAVMAAVTGAMRRYAIEIKDDQVLKTGAASVECKSMVMVACPRPIDETDMTSALCNKVLFASMRIPIEEPSAKKRMERTVLACNDLKSMSYMSGLVGFTSFITKIAPQSLLNKACAETFSKHTLLVTNVPATSVPATWPAEGGSPIDAVSACIANVMTQVSLISYNGFLYASVVADPELISDATALGKFWVEEFDILGAA